MTPSGVLAFWVLLVSFAFLRKPPRRRPLDDWHVTSRFGWRVHPVSGVRKFHDGLDLRAPLGTAIRAPEAGHVEEKYSAGGGEIAYLVTPGGVTYVFMHCSSIYTGPVEEGGVVALSGATGRVTGPHVHLEVRTGPGVKVDPEEWFA